ncbi:MAG: LacI family DNA-binding transcriptional regulator [Chloroflexi bacterium]|nr:LacI family DNA-binding transcriptional regulator [Chloroflexota bacterium]
MRSRRVSHQKVTISQIAKEAGVSKTAVSFAFNDPSQLSPATASHIRAIAERLGYSPDPIARSMTTRQTNALGVLLPQDIATTMDNPFFPQFLRGIGVVCGAAGKTLMLVPPLWGSVLKAIPHATVDGFVVVGLEVDRGEVQQLRRRHVPFVMVDSDAPDDVPAINVDDHCGARAAMLHILGQGHRRIAIVCLESWRQRYEEYTGTLAARLAGYRAGLEAYGRSLDDGDVQVIAASASRAGGVEAFTRLWNDQSPPTAIITMSDITALGILDAAAARSVRVPEQLAVVGFDDLPEAAHATPPLTTVRQPIEAKGKLAAELLVQALEQESEPVHHVLRTELIIRGSTCAPLRSGRANNESA